MTEEVGFGEEIQRPDATGGRMNLGPPDFEAIERATVAGVAPRILEEDDGWLLAIDDGFIGRANSLTPLREGGDLAARVARAEARYASEGLSPAFRLPGHTTFPELEAVLAGRGYRPEAPVSVQLGEAATVIARVSDPPADVSEAPDKAWASVFVSDGFDAADGLSRVRSLSRSPGAVYAAVREGDLASAVGVASFGFGWAGIHGMRTARAFRGRGLARRVLSALGQAIHARGYERIYLQVDPDNVPAMALYRRAGFSPAWTYVYWRRSD